MPFHLYATACRSIMAVVITLINLPSLAGEIPRFKLSNCQAGSGAEENCRHHVDVAEAFRDYALMAADTYRAMDRITWYRIHSKAKSNGHDTNCEDQEKLTDDEKHWCEDAMARFGDRVYFDTPVAQLDYASDCPEHRGKDAAGRYRNGVTIPTVIPGWARLYDFDRTPTPRSFYIFVPGLFVEVWVRDGPEEQPSEYAIVFRGTQGGGGWWSNLRFLTTLFPLFHDQYSQAARLYPRLMDQIDLREEQKGRPAGQRRITLVGHSLGAGLAMYVAMRNPGVNRIIGFNPTPVSGYLSISHQERTARLAKLEQVDFVFENSEILHKVNACNDGERFDPELPAPIRCHEINLAGGNIITQHEIGPMACRLAVLGRDATKLRAALQSPVPTQQVAIGEQTPVRSRAAPTPP